MIGEIRYAKSPATASAPCRFIALRETDRAEVRPTTRHKTPRRWHRHQQPRPLVYPKPPVTKLAVARYYEAIATGAGNRPQPPAIVAPPAGWVGGAAVLSETPGQGFPDAMRQIDLQLQGRGADKMYLTRPASLIAAVQMGTLEFHIEGVHIDKPSPPTGWSLTSTPMRGSGFGGPRCRRATAICWPRSDCQLADGHGGKGVQVVVRCAALPAPRQWRFRPGLRQSLGRTSAEAFTATMSTSRRRGKIFIDWLRMTTPTAIAPFSLRARPGAPVAVPVSWDELKRSAGQTPSECQPLTRIGTEAVR